MGKWERKREAVEGSRVLTWTTRRIKKMSSNMGESGEWSRFLKKDWLVGFGCIGLEVSIRCSSAVKWPTKDMHLLDKREAWMVYVNLGVVNV